MKFGELCYTTIVTNTMGRIFNIMDIQYYRFGLGEIFYTQKPE